MTTITVATRVFGVTKTFNVGESVKCDGKTASIINITDKRLCLSDGRMIKASNALKA